MNMKSKDPFPKDRANLTKLKDEPATPEKLEKLILVDMGPDINREGGQRISREIIEVPEEFDSFEAVAEYMTKQNRFASDSVIRRRLTYSTKLLSNGKIGWKYDLAIREQRRQGTVPASDDLWPEIPKITCPTLIVRGMETDVLAAEVAQRMVDVMPNAQIVEVPRAGHMVFEDNPTDFNAAVGAFLR